MSLTDVLEIAIETGIDVLSGEKTFLEGIESVLEQTGNK